MPGVADLKHLALFFKCNAFAAQRSPQVVDMQNAEAMAQHGGLKVGGRLSAIVGEQPVMRATLITRVTEDAWRTAQAWDTVAPRLLNFPEPSKFSF